MKRTFFDQIHIAGHTLRNRFVVAPMTRFSASDSGVPTTQMAGYYERFARGGFAMIITEGVYTDDVAAKCHVGQPGMTTREQSNGWEQITSRIRQSGALAIC